MAPGPAIRPAAGAAPAAIIVVALGAVALGGAWCAARLRRVVVAGTSMAPTLLPGDRLLVLRGLPIRVGSLVAVRDPRLPAARLMVKRVEALGPRGVDVRGDAPAASTDSRTFGPVPRGLVEGTVVWRYGPPWRSGRPDRIVPASGGRLVTGQH